ncbi:hypothetical protein V3851_22395 [Paenibacillus sp. M1]|uniref:Uncharacterized protein n=1 Tax=Paenibacillus haidiansis TaxID=1574488 RepID=A0ABU7VXT1_9BACL
MNKRTGISILLAAILLSGCSTEKPGAGTEGPGNSNNSVRETTTLSEQETGQDVTWYSENHEVKLSPIKENDTGGYERVTIEVNGVQKDFDWRFSTLGEPLIYYTDVTGDGEEEAVVILNLGKGTGLSIDEIHVLNSKDLSEIKVQSYEEITADQVETHITNHNDILAIKVEAQGKKYEFSYESPFPDLDQEQLYFGGVVYYHVEDQTIVSTLGASFGISPQYVCDVRITYKFDKARNELIADRIEVKPYD